MIFSVSLLFVNGNQVYNAVKTLRSDSEDKAIDIAIDTAKENIVKMNKGFYELKSTICIQIDLEELGLVDERSYRNVGNYKSNDLQTLLQRAVDREDYEQAAQIRNQINALNESE